MRAMLYFDVSLSHMLCVSGLKTKSASSLFSITKLENFLANRHFKDCEEVLKEILLETFPIFKNPGEKLEFGSLLPACDSEVYTFCIGFLEKYPFLGSQGDVEPVKLSLLSMFRNLGFCSVMMTLCEH